MQGRILSILFLDCIFLICNGVPIQEEKKKPNGYENTRYDSGTDNNDGIGEIVYEEGDDVENHVDDNDWLHMATPDDTRHAPTPDKDNEEFVNLPLNGEIFEEDIIMDNRLRNAVFSGKSKRSWVTGIHVTWPNGIVYYEFDKSFPKKSKELLMKVFKQFEKRTCVKFNKRTIETAYVVFSSKKDSCSSSVGRSGKKQIVYLGEKCAATGTFEHEIMHVLGFIHEHSRPDRDKFVKIHYKNIMKNQSINFQKYTFGLVNEKEDYNFASIMHYRNDAFTKDGNNTISSVDEPGLIFGQRVKLSVGDVHQINVLYKCDKFLKTPNYKGLFKSYHGSNGTKHKHFVWRNAYKEYHRRFPFHTVLHRLYNPEKNKIPGKWNLKKPIAFGNLILHLLISWKDKGVEKNSDYKNISYAQQRR